jgi:hypothetical protein
LPVLNDKQQILSLSDEETVIVTVPEWNNETVRLQSMTAAMRDCWESAILARKELPEAERGRGLRTLLLSLCIVNERGQRIFDDPDVHDLATKNAKAIDRLFDAAMALNRIGDKDLEDAEKN